MQHSSVVMGLVHMNPETCLELEAHQTPMPCGTCRSSLLPCCPATPMAFTFYSGNRVYPSFCGLGATVGWVGASNLFQLMGIAESGASCVNQPCSHCCDGAWTRPFQKLLSPTLGVVLMSAPVELPFTFPLALNAAMGLELDHSKSCVRQP